MITITADTEGELISHLAMQLKATIESDANALVAYAQWVYYSDGCYRDTTPEGKYRLIIGPEEQKTLEEADEG